MNKIFNKIILFNKKNCNDKHLTDVIFYCITAVCTINPNINYNLSWQY